MNPSPKDALTLEELHEVETLSTLADTRLRTGGVMRFLRNDQRRAVMYEELARRYMRRGHRVDSEPLQIAIWPL